MLEALVDESYPIECAFILNVFDESTRHESLRSLRRTMFFPRIEYIFGAPSKIAYVLLIVQAQVEVVPRRDREGLR